MSVSIYDKQRRKAKVYEQYTKAILIGILQTGTIPVGVAGNGEYKIVRRRVTSRKLTSSYWSYSRLNSYNKDELIGLLLLPDEVFEDLNHRVAGTPNRFLSSYEKREREHAIGILSEDKKRKMEIIKHYLPNASEKTVTQMMKASLPKLKTVLAESNQHFKHRGASYDTIAKRIERDNNLSEPRVREKPDRMMNTLTMYYPVHAARDTLLGFKHPMSIRETIDDAAERTWSVISNMTQHNSFAKVTMTAHVILGRKVLSRDKAGETVTEYLDWTYHENETAHNKTTFITNITNNLNEQIVENSVHAIYDYVPLCVEKVVATIYNAVKKTGGSYIALPKWLPMGSAVNVKNPNDDMCFIWSLCTYHFHERATKDTVSSLAFYKRMVDFRNNNCFYNLPFLIAGVNCPTAAKDIDTFTANNPNYHITVNVIGDTPKLVEERYLSGNIEAMYKVNLVYYKGHYAWLRRPESITTMRRANRHAMYICPNCQTDSFNTQESMHNHYKHCVAGGSTLINMPSKGNNTLRFKHYNHMMRQHFILVSDFECFTSDGQAVSGCSPMAHTSDGQADTKHRAASYAIFLAKVPKGFNHERYYQYDITPEMMEMNNEDYERHLLRRFHYHLRLIMTLIDDHIGKMRAKWKTNMYITPEQEEAFRQANKCEYCERTLKQIRKSDDKVKHFVKHHDHITGDYLGPSCNACNLLMRSPKGASNQIPIYFHNGAGYDTNLIFRMLSDKENSVLDFEPIMQSGEKTLSMSMRFMKPDGKYTLPLCVKDSMKLFSSGGVSLDRMVSNLAGSDSDLNTDKLPLTKQHLEHTILCQKGVFPYEYLNTPKRFTEPSLPPQKDFNSVISGECNNKDYEHAQKVFTQCGYKSFKDYHDAYLKADVLLLSDVLNAFCDVMYTNYKLDPSYYLTVSSYTWDAMLLHTGVNLELLTEHEMYMFFEKQKRGGFTCAVQRHVQADNDSSLWYTDCNNLYGWAMLQKLPMKDFKWIENPSLFTKEAILAHNDNANTSYALEVTLNYPQHLHDKHWDYPLAPYNKQVDVSLHSSFQAKHRPVKFRPTEKLVADFTPRVQQIYDIRYLKLLLQQGLELVQVHRGISYTQSTWLADYIQMNTRLRQAGKNDFEKDLFKLMNNAVFGKTMENVRNRIKPKILVNPSDKDILDQQSSSLFDYNRVAIGDMMIFSKKKREVTLNKPVYVGSSILDMSKYKMSDFYYNVLVEQIGRENMSLVYTDTDSFIIRFKGNLNTQLLKIKEHIDGSNYPTDHPLYTKQHDKVPGFFKDEVPEGMKEVIALRAKSYHYTTMKDKCTVKAKGCPKKQAKGLTQEDYTNVLTTGDVKSVGFYSIRSKNHNLQTMFMDRKVLSTFDDKRYTCSDGIMTLPYGYQGTVFSVLVDQK